MSNGYRQPRGLMHFDGIPSCYPLPIERDDAIREALCSYAGWRHVTEAELELFRGITNKIWFRRVLVADAEADADFEAGMWSDVGSGQPWEFWYWDISAFSDLVGSIERLEGTGPRD